MAATPLTKVKIEAAVRAGCPAGKPYLMLWDAGMTGLGLKIRSTGSCSWIFVYRPKNVGRRENTRTVTLGAWPGLTLDAARTAAQAHTGRIALGADPAADIREERTRERRVLSAALEGYEAFRKRERFVNTPTILSTLRRGLAPLLSRQVDGITQAELVERIDVLKAEGKPGAAADLRKHARTMLAWAKQRGLRADNPLADLRVARGSRADRLEAESRKGRALADREIAAVWRSSQGVAPFAGLVRLALLSGMRRGELAELRWGDVRDDRIVLPAAKTKSGVAHEIPLTEAMRAVLATQPRMSSDRVFGSTKKPGVALVGWSKLIAPMNRDSGVDFRLHDLRRTCRTVMSRCGIPEDVAEIAIGHARRGLVGLYNKDDGWAARVAAFEAVSNHVVAIAPGADPQAADNAIVTLPARKQVA